MDFLYDADNYLWLKSFHLISVMSWMAGMLYLPRLFVYHTQTEIGTDEYARFCTMERKLMRGIVNPAMILSFIFGIALIISIDALSQHWFHAKLLILFFMTGIHGMLSKYRKAFLRNENVKSEKFFRIINEIPAILMIIIIILAVTKPI